MIPNPIHKVLSTLSTHQVQYLLMGGQACVFYGAAEFSRDCDIALLCDPANLKRLRDALSELKAQQIAVPSLEAEYLQKGHVVHFRCQAPGVERIRLDVMSKMRGVAEFNQLWQRRTTITDDQETTIELMSLPDLVAAKKTQRDKDWPMIRRLVEANLAQHRENANDEQIRFWLLTSRTPEDLLDLAASYPQLVREVQSSRPLLLAVGARDTEGLRQELAKEEFAERRADERYWLPLKKELEHLRHRG